ncbi:carbohydrate ABC transporter permease [Evansella cellulosilytica]|uniref:Binding-protein-dependent transport systems inner membrane component n=1 Tax=Evansella cellulosilytica (strain ATCC 21833 / DSM 2522 / FERM P-1141 / JCM 9156 / N-4) TaxID=649639 RepID=E6TZA8_EVAC2|nr:carbohydrate ABC transporter permease [Evansella cellulosilytica]ADU28970.1 binding-protein-dependent transport systems inner membrane component [Evansella cellulosilytica DSM 2522]
MNKRGIAKIIIYTFLILLLVISFIPFYMMIVNATRSTQEILQHGFTLFPSNAIMDNYEILISYMNLWRGFANSLFIAVCVTLLSSYFSALTAYGFAVYKFKGSNFLFITVLVLMMVPGQLGLIGFFDLINTLGFLDTYVPLIIPPIASPFIVFFLRQFLVTTMHPSLLEAARIDGASELRIFHQIGFPIMMPAVATMAIFTFIGSWNNYILPLVVLFSPEKYTLPVMMGALRGSQVAQNLGAMYLGIAISVVPIMIAFLFLSKYIISSISAGAVKE